MPVAPFQYLESHDHSQLITFVEAQPAGMFLSGIEVHSTNCNPLRLRSIPVSGHSNALAGTGVCRELLSAGSRQRAYQTSGVMCTGNTFMTILGSPLVRLYRITAGTPASAIPHYAVASPSTTTRTNPVRRTSELWPISRRSSANGQIAVEYLEFL